MAIVSSHILDSMSGVAAAGIRARLLHLDRADRDAVVFDVRTDREGRIAETIHACDWDKSAEYELVFHCGDYFSASAETHRVSPTDTIVLRLAMPVFNKRYHMPVMLSPHSYAVWWSA